MQIKKQLKNKAETIAEENPYPVEWVKKEVSSVLSCPTDRRGNKDHYGGNSAKRYAYAIGHHLTYARLKLGVAVACRNDGDGNDHRGYLDYLYGQLADSFVDYFVLGLLGIVGIQILYLAEFICCPRRAHE